VRGEKVVQLWNRKTREALLGRQYQRARATTLNRVPIIDSSRYQTDHRWHENLGYEDRPSNATRWPLRLFEASSSPRTSRCVAVADEKQAQLWNLEHLKAQWGVPIDLPEDLRGLQINNDGRLVWWTNATASKFGIWRMEVLSGPRFIVVEHKGQFAPTQLSPDGRRLLARADDQHFSLLRHVHRKNSSVTLRSDR